MIASYLPETETDGVLHGSILELIGSVGHILQFFSAFPYYPSRHATMLLHNRSLQGIYECAVQLPRQCHEHVFIDEEPLGGVSY